MSRAAYQPAAASGNAPAGLFLQRKCACGAQAQAISGECEDCQREHLLGVQPKLRIGAADDPLEREADRIAAQVTASAATPPDRRAAGGTLALQRRAAGLPAGTSASAPPAVMRTMRESGQALPAGRRAFFEARMGHDFSSVRIHTGGAAARSADAIDAHAYTVGHHIVFGSRHGPAADGIDTALMAHELAHTIQQGVAPRLGRAATSPALMPWIQRAPRGACATHMTQIGTGPVCKAPPRADVIGSRIHGLIARSFLAESPTNHVTELPVPFAPKSSVHGSGSPIVPKGVKSLGNVDLAKVVSRSASAVRIQIAEVKPMNWTGFAQAEAEINYYRAKLEDARDDCIRYKTDFLEPLEARLSGLPADQATEKRRQAMKEAGALLGSHVFCKKLDAVGKQVLLASPFGLAIRPRTLTLPGRKPRKVLVRTCDAGVVSYRCLEKPDKKKKKKKARKSKRKVSKRQARQIAKRTERQVERKLRKEVTERVARRAIARQVGKVAGRLALRAIPVVGWVLLAIDVAEAAHGLYKLIKYGPGDGGEGGEGGGGDKSGSEGGQEGTEGAPGSDTDRAGDTQDAHSDADEPGGTGGTGGDQDASGAGTPSGSEQDGDATAAGAGGKTPDIDPELARLGIFDSVEQAEAYAETLPLSQTLLAALKASTPEQQQLLEQMLADASDGTLPRVDEAFLLRMLEITRDMSAAELAALSAALVPASGQTLEDVLKRVEDAIKAIREGKTLDGSETTPKGDKPAEPGPPASVPDDRDTPANTRPADATIAKPSRPDVAKGKDGKGSGGKGGRADGKGATGDKADKGKTAGDKSGQPATGESDRATAPPAGTTSTPSGVFGFLILSGMSPASTPKAGQTLSCTLRIADFRTGRAFTLTHVDLVFEGRRDERTTVNGVEYVDTTFTVHFAADFWSEKNSFHGLGGAGSTTEYRFPRRKAAP